LADLVRRAQYGDVFATNELLRHIAPYVLRLCTPIAMQNALDAAQEAMIAIFRSLPQLKEPAALLGWVRIICVREAARVACRNSRTVAAELCDVPMRGDPQLAIDIEDVLRRLSPEHQAVLTLRDLQDLDEKTAARVLSLPLGTVRSRLHRARDAFRKAWG
jgi:RNA polymerase sigma-70 factor (ECF subfamily)